MISVEPQTSINLCHVHWENDYKNQRTFTTVAKQNEYFNGLTHATYTNFTYQRKDGYITVGDNIETLRKYNYVYYTNTGFSNKVFYAFITNMEYISENSTRLEIETDVFQTYQFDLIYHKCFVEREHVNTSDDVIGANTVPENIETGEYICNNVVSLYADNTNCYICIATTFVPDSSDTNPAIPVLLSKYYGNVFSGCYYLIFQDSSSATQFIMALDQNDKADAIQSIFMVPQSLCMYDYPTPTPITFDTYTITYNGHNFYCTLGVLQSTENPFGMGTVNVDLLTTLDGYTPKNKKLYCYPYNYFYVSDNVGNSVEYHYEDFVNNAPSFKTLGTVSPGCSIFVYPLNYKKLQDDLSFDYGSSFNYGLPVPKYPMCSWVSDAYTNWLVQNGRNLDVTALAGVGSIGAGIGLATTGVGTIAGIGMIMGGIGAISSTIVQNYSKSFLPPSGNGTNSGDIAFTSRNFDMPAKQMSVRSEYAKIIDDYFEMFGYKICRLKLPNITGRPYWNYVKTIDCNVEAPIPEDDLLLIRQMFNNGVTLWHTDDMYDYSKNNH